MKTVPDKCPFCESPIMVHGGNLLRSDNCGFSTYECRTVYDTELYDNQWKRAEQSVSCRIRENQLLAKQRDEARERIKRLIAERDTAQRQADSNWRLREEFRELLGTDDVLEAVNVVRGMQERIKRLESAGDYMEVCLYDGSIGSKAIKSWRKAKEAQP